MPTLILSGGTGKDNEEKINSLFLKLVKNKPILYIPIARKAKEYSECYDWISSALKKKNIFMLVDLKLQKINLKNFAGIYISGGNTFKLLKEIKENKFDSKLKNFKGVICGGSAGAIIFGKDISTASFGTESDKNLVKLKDLRGLNLVSNYDLQCHYFPKEKSQILKHMKKTKNPVIAMPEDSGIYVNGKKIKPINKVYLFS